MKERTADSYLTLAGPVRAQLTEKKSVFEARLERVSSEAAAREVIEATRKEHWEAGHHCSAFILGPTGMLARSSDDGEPSGTAGMPMLDVLTGAGVRDVVAVVTRWFGGVLLGSGGLVRAYGGAVRLALDEARIISRERRMFGAVEVDAAEAGRVENDLRGRGVQVLDAEYGARVVLSVASAPEAVDRVQAAVAQSTHGRGRVQWQGEGWVDNDSVE